MGSFAKISIHALLAESDNSTVGRFTPLEISIHALLAESDIWREVLELVQRHFYPRSPCGERQRAEIHANSQQEFLSTLSLRRATVTDTPAFELLPISIHALLAESDHSRGLDKAETIKISIHALLAESDPLDEFQDLAPDISIHALLAESDK